VADHGLARVQAHSHLDLEAGIPVLVRQRRLRGCCRGDGSAGAAEDGEERVPLVVDLDSPRGLERLLEQAVVDREELPIAVTAERLQELRRALDVREQEGHGPGRKLLSSYAQVLTPFTRRTSLPRAILDDLPKTLGLVLGGSPNANGGSCAEDCGQAARAARERGGIPNVCSRNHRRSA